MIQQRRRMTNHGESREYSEFLTWQIYLLTLFAKVKFSRKFPNLQVHVPDYLSIENEKGQSLNLLCQILPRKITKLKGSLAILV